MWTFQISAIVLTLTVVVTGEATKLNDAISRYEGVAYDRVQLQANHYRARRSADGEVKLNFHALGRHFKLRLRRSTSVFSHDFKVETSNGVERYDTSFIYSGKLQDDELSHCHGSIVNGTFVGAVYVDNEQYYIEPSQKYFQEKQSFHSLIYMGKDVKMPEGRHGSTGCSMDAEVFSRMSEIQKSMEKDDSEFVPKQRKARADGDKDTCGLYIETDHTFYQRYGSYDEVVSAVSSAVEAANYIYEQIEFGTLTNIGFRIKRLRIFTPDDRTNPAYLFANENIGVEKYLDIASSRNFDDYCLAYTFSGRDFSTGILGLAWIAYASDTQGGGICDIYRQYTYQGWRSLNTGVLTIINYGLQVTPVVYHLTLAHELGHSLGSPHDYPLQCKPGGEQGNYIMYARSSDGSKQNNNKFSTCTIGNITSVLVAKKDKCFEERDAAICGNDIIEGDEECDCGLEGDCYDPCCVPQSLDFDNLLACKRIAGAVCSLSEGPCCESSTCQFKSTDVECRSQGECHNAASCSGDSVECPASQNIADSTLCEDGTQTCQAGECSGSVCDLFGLEECTCTRDDEYCHLCCRNIGRTETCVSASKWLNIYDINGNPIFVHPGTPCNDFQGYCDSYQQCQLVDQDGPLISIINKIFKPTPGEDLMDTLLKWIKANWWVILVAGLVLIVLMLLTVILCTRVCPTDNPAKKRNPSRHPVSLRKKRYRQSQMPGHHPIYADQHPDRAEERATRM
ncbi:disintegrin and metalloproteinase domain-containing protein 10-like [Glandiceps talaboti]